MLTIWVQYLAMATAALGLVVGLHSLRGTTLVAPCRWALGSLAMLAAVEALVDLSYGHPAHVDSWRFLAAGSTYCPGIALLGAKRPQHRSWQWIVATLWLIIALPAIQQLAIGKAESLEVHWARSWFMLGMTLFCASNSLISRYWPAVLAAGCGQLAMISLFTSSPWGSPSSLVWKWGLISLCAAVPLTWLNFSRPARQPLDQLWLDFRNRFGIVWSLRLMEQFNAGSETNGWNLRLHWSGFHTVDGSADWELPPEQFHVLRQSLQNLLRRFVSPEWITARLRTD